MKTFEEIEKEFRKRTKNCTYEAYGNLLRHAIEQGFEATKVKRKSEELAKYYDWPEGFNTALSAVKSAQEKFLGGG